jgi:hypothetical protein
MNRNTWLELFLASFPYFQSLLHHFQPYERMTQNRYKLRSMTRRFDVGQPTTARAKSRTENRGLREVRRRNVLYAVEES